MTDETLDAVLEGMARAMAIGSDANPDDACVGEPVWRIRLDDARDALSSEPLASLLKRAVEALGPFAAVRTRDRADDEICPVEVCFTRKEAEKLNAQIDLENLPIKKAGTDPCAPDAGMHWPRHVLSLDGLNIGNLRAAASVLADLKALTDGVEGREGDRPQGAGWSKPPTVEGPHPERLSAADLKLTGSVLSEWAWDCLSKGYGVTLTVREAARLIAAVRESVAPSPTPAAIPEGWTKETLGAHLLAKWREHLRVPKTEALTDIWQGIAQNALDALISARPAPPEAKGEAIWKDGE